MSSSPLANMAVSERRPLARMMSETWTVGSSLCQVPWAAQAALGRLQSRSAECRDPATTSQSVQATASREVPHQHSLRRDTSQPGQSACLAGQPAAMQHKWDGAGTQLLLPHKLCTRAGQRPAAHACTSCVMKLLLCRPLLRTLPEVEGVPLDLSSTCRQATLPVLQDDYSMT